MKIQIQELKLGDTKVSKFLRKFIIVSGKRDTGKTYVTRAIANDLRNDVDFAVIFSPTANAHGLFNGMVDEKFVKSEEDEDFLIKLKNMQQSREKMGKRMFQILLIVDDMGFDETFINSKTMKFIAMNGRHYQFTVLITLQDCMSLTKKLRGQTDYIFTMFEDRQQYRKNLHDGFFGCVSFKHFSIIMNKITVDYRSLVCNQNDNTGILNNKLFHFKADINAQNHRIGSPVFWMIHDICNGIIKLPIIHENEEEEKSDVIEVFCD